MVESGQVTEFGYSNPDHSHLGVQVLDFADLVAKLPVHMLTTVHRADFHQIFLVTGGTGGMMVDFVDRPCSAGTLVHVAPGRVLRLPSTGLDVTMVVFTPDFPPRLDRATALLGTHGPVTWPVPPGALGVDDLAAEYRRAVHDPDPVTVDVLRHLLAALLLRAARLAPAAPPGRTAAFQRFQHELERSFAETRNAADYATRIGYSPRSLNRLCQTATGRTAKGLIDARVTLEAKRLLAHTDLPVVAIATRLGFTEPTNFGKFFTRETGATPGAFRAGERA